MEALVSVDRLAQHLDDPDLRVFDATVQVSRVLFLPRIRTGEREYRRGHIPGSGFLDLFEVHDPARSRLSMTAPSAAHLEHVVACLGIGNQHRIVLYDRRESMWAAGCGGCCGRSAMMMRPSSTAVGTRGRALGRRPATGSAAVRPHGSRPTLARGLLVDKRDVLAAIDDPHVQLVDAPGRRVHRGEVNEYGRRGHIPGAASVTAWEILDRDTGCHRPLHELRDKAGGVPDADRVIVYCGSGAAAASVAHVLTRQGHPDVAVHDGGLLEWAADRSLPLQTGA